MWMGVLWKLMICKPGSLLQSSRPFWKSILPKGGKSMGGTPESVSSFQYGGIICVYIYFMFNKYKNSICWMKHDALCYIINFSNVGKVYFLSQALPKRFYHRRCLKGYKDGPAKKHKINWPQLWEEGAEVSGAGQMKEPWLGGGLGL